MNSYHEIYSLPFRNFNLGQFVTWRDLLNRLKKSNFETASFGEFLQIVYYHLAINNHVGAIWFIKKCYMATNEYTPLLYQRQIIFLEILFHKSDNFYSSCSIFYRKILVDLCLVKYKPALLLFYKKSTYFNYTRALLDFDKYFINDKDDKNMIGYDIIIILSQIEKNMKGADIDIYYINDLRQRINDLTQLSEEGAGVITLPILIPEILCLAKMGSNKALLKVLGCDINSIEKEIGPYSNVRSVPICNIDKPLIVSAETVLYKMLMDKISFFDVTFISALLKIYETIGNRPSTYVRKNSVIDHTKVIVTCVDSIYQYVVDGGNDMEVILSYISFVSQSTFKLNQCHVILCRAKLLEYYSQGFIFFHKDSIHDIHRHSDYLAHLYQDLNFELSREKVVDSMDIIKDFVENAVWYSRTVNGQCEDGIPPGRVRLFHFMFKISPLLWEIALCIIGIDLTNETIYIGYEEQMPFSIFSYYRPGSRYKNYTNLVSNLLRKLLQVMQQYSTIFGSDLETVEDINIKDLNRIAKRIEVYCYNFGQFSSVDQSSFDQKEILPFVYKLCDRCIKYIKPLNLHAKYMPESKEYSIAKAHFENRDPLC